jgi:hypothetical protein
LVEYGYEFEGFLLVKQALYHLNQNLYSTLP